MTSTKPSDPIDQPLRDVAEWTARLLEAEIPVLADTAEALEAMRANEDRVDANSLGELVATDPLMTLKVLAAGAASRSPRVVTEIETVTGVLVMMGIPPFFRAFGPQPVLEVRMAAQPEALAGTQKILRRARQAANYALAFAAHRLDPDAPVIHAAALLHDFAELLLWCHAPSLALQIRDAQRADPSLRTGAAQRRFLNVELAEVQQSLMKAWRLPRLLVRLSDDRHAEQADVLSISLATRLARHTAAGWDNPAIPDDIAALAELLNLSSEATLDLVRSI